MKYIFLNSHSNSTLLFMFSSNMFIPNQHDDYLADNYTFLKLLEHVQYVRHPLLLFAGCALQGFAPENCCNWIQLYTTVECPFDTEMTFTSHQDPREFIDIFPFCFFSCSNMKWHYFCSASHKKILAFHSAYIFRPPQKNSLGH